MRRLSKFLGFLVLGSGLLVPSASYAQQALNFTVGGFVPKGEDSRVRTGNTSDDVLVNNQDFLAFNIGDFNGGTVGAEYTVGIGRWLDAGLGVSFYKRNVPSVYLNLVNQDGSEIEQNLRLRIVPFTASVRFLPLGHGPIEPYVGAGVGIFNWRYSESGDWVDSADNSVFHASYVGSGTATGPIVFGGVKFGAGPFAVGGEVKYQDAKGDLPLDQEFSANRIDLGGWTYNAIFSVRF